MASFCKKGRPSQNITSGLGPACRIGKKAMWKGDRHFDVWKRNIHCRLTEFLCLSACLTGLSMLSCDAGFYSATITAEEFRFTPNLVKFPAGKEVRLVIRNQGRERHVFQSPILAFKNVRVDGHSRASGGKGGEEIQLKPGERNELWLVLPEGYYPFQCRIKGHKGMEGALVVGQ